MEKVVNGITYITQESINTCRGCVGYNDGDYGDLCESLAEPDCGWKYVFVSKGVKAAPKETPTEGVKYDDDKLKYSLIPSYALEAVAQNLTDGLKKYPARNNWMLVEKAQERYLDALYRHLEAHRRGEIYDTDNINPENTHMAAVVANAMFLLEFMLNPELKGNE